MVRYLDVRLDYRTVTAIVKLLHLYVRSIEPDGTKDCLQEMTWAWHLVEQFQPGPGTKQINRANTLFYEMMRGEIGSERFDAATRSRKLTWRDASEFPSPPSSAGSTLRCFPPGGIKNCCSLCSGDCCVPEPPHPERMREPPY